MLMQSALGLWMPWPGVWQGLAGHPSPKPLLPPSDRLSLHRLQPVPTERVAAFPSLLAAAPFTLQIKLTSQKPGRL